MRMHLLAMLIFALKLFFLIFVITAGSFGNQCNENWLDCGNGKCISYIWECDGENDCGNFKDEENCQYKLSSEECLNNQFQCTSDKRCIVKKWHCDGEQDCDDGSDEIGCGDDCKNFSCSQECKSTPKGPQCYCVDGYLLDAKDNKTCLDVDECKKEGLCNYKCINTIGSYKCSCRDGYELVNKTCKVKGANPLLVYTTFKEIHAMILPGNDSTLIRRASGKATQVDIDLKNIRVYWIETSNKSTIYSAKIDGSDFKTVLSDGLLIAEDIAVDYITNNLYITDLGLKQIVVCKIDGSLCSALHDENIGKPRSIVLDLAEGFVYWSDWGENTAGIYRSGMDGSHRVSLVSSHIAWPNAIAIDHSTNRLYWADAKLNKIECMSLNGTSRKVIYGKREFHPYSIDVFEDTLYWTDWSTSSLEFCNKFTGLNVKRLKQEDGVPFNGVHVYHPILTVTVSNPCLSSECSHMCLISPVSGFRCACSYGFELGKDGKTCRAKQIAESLFVSEGSSIFHILPNAVGKGIITKLPLQIPTEIQKLTYDRNLHFLFVAAIGPPAIYVVSMLSLNMRELVKDHIEMPLDLAFDFKSNNLYWIDKEKGTVEVISIDSLRRSVLIENITKPVSLAISPEDGIMFIAIGGINPSLIKYDMDGKNKMILASIQGKAISLTINPSPATLFWADSKSGKIWYANNKNLRFPQIALEEIYDIMSIAVNEDYIYWTTAKRELNFRKANRTHILQLPGEVKGVHIKRVAYSPATFHMGISECFIGNGGCSYLCLTSPRGRTCACPTELMLDHDNMSCVGNKGSGKSPFSITLNIGLNTWFCEEAIGAVGSTNKENHRGTCNRHNLTCELYGKNKIKCDGTVDCIDDLAKETNPIAGSDSRRR